MGRFKNLNTKGLKKGCLEKNIFARRFKFQNYD